MNNNSFMSSDFMSSDDIRHQFSVAMSAMYQAEVPLYGDLVDLVTDVNSEVLAAQPDLKAQLENTGEMNRLSMERHGAIRVGTAVELSMMRRLFAVMGMYPVGYYDLAPAGVPVHSTAFRATDAESLSKSPFRVFTSLLRLDLIGDETLKEEAVAALARRNIFTDTVIELIESFEAQGGLSEQAGQQFVVEALETFRWHDSTSVSKALYEKLLQQHGLIADVVGFKGPHINHLTPRTLDIDTVQHSMKARGIPPKAIIEGPPKRNCPILLRQTSFKALEEAVRFKNTLADAGQSSYEQGQHTARFGEIEQRGVALTPKGRALYDKLLSDAREQLGMTPNEANASQYYQILEATFAEFPDDYQTLHKEGLAYFYYQPVDNSNTDLQLTSLETAESKSAIVELIEKNVIRIEPIVYEDFLPVSAAGIFQSNLRDNEQSSYEGSSNQQEFEKALGFHVQDELALYETTQAQSLQDCFIALQKTA